MFGWLAIHIFIANTEISLDQKKAYKLTVSGANQGIFLLASAPRK